MSTCDLICFQSLFQSQLSTVYRNIEVDQTLKQELRARIIVDLFLLFLYVSLLYCALSCVSNHVSLVVLTVNRGSKFKHINFIYFRMFHIDDVPSGAGEGIKDISKALAVCTAYLTLSK